jgi:hypothetical protein
LCTPLPEGHAQIGTESTAQGAISGADLVAEFSESPAVGRVVSQQVAHGPYAGIRGCGELDWLLRGGPELVEQDGAQPAACGAVVVGVAGAGEDQLAQQRTDAQHGGCVEAEWVGRSRQAE